MEARTRVFTFRVTKEQKARVEQAAKAAGQTTSEWMRGVFRREMEVQPVALWEVE